MKADRVFEQFYPQLQSICSKILSGTDNFSDLFGMDKFLPFLDLFQKETVRVQVCKAVMQAFARSQDEMTSDPVIISALMFIGRVRLSAFVPTPSIPWSHHGTSWSSIHNVSHTTDPVSPAMCHWLLVLRRGTLVWILAPELFSTLW